MSSGVVVSSKSDTALACTPTVPQVTFDDARHATVVPDVSQIPALVVSVLKCVLSNRKQTA